MIHQFLIPSDKKYVVGRDIVLANGGEVKVIDLVEGFFNHKHC